MTFEIVKAERKGAKVVIQFAGMSNCGKTYSSLRMARGLVGEKGKIGFIDTEQKRASLYADCFGGFDVINLEAPFTPERYTEAIDVFKNSGYDCVIIDSMSHEWEGVGGILDIAENQTYGNGKAMTGLSKWNIPKTRHKNMMNHMMHCGMNIICCYRAKKPLEEKNIDGKKVMVEGPMQICSEHKNAYDITVSIILDEATKKPILPINRCPEGIEYLFKPDEYINEETGRGIIDWLNNKQRDKDTLIKEGARQKDIKSWAETLTASERSLARKYWNDIKALSSPAIESKPIPVKQPEENKQPDELGDL